MQCCENGHILIICVNMSFALFLDMVVKVLCALRKNENLKMMYHFEGRIARCDGYCISRDVLRAAMVTIIEGRVVRRDRCLDRYIPHESRI